MFEVFLFDLLKILILFATLVVLNITLMTSGQLFSNKRSLFSRSMKMSSISSLQFYATFFKLIFKKHKAIHLYEFLFAILFVFFSCLPLLFIPLTKTFENTDALVYFDTSKGLLFCFITLAIFPLLKIILQFTYTNYSIQIEGVRKIKEYLSWLIIFVLIYTILFQIFGTNDLSVIFDRISIDSALKSFPAAVILFSLLISEFRKCRSEVLITNLNRGDNTCSAYFTSMIILSENIYFISFISVFITFFIGGDDIILGVMAKYKVLMQITGVLFFFLKVFIINSIVVMVHGFNIKKSNNSALDLDLDVKILILLMNLVFVSV